jgi:flagellar biosynthesis protein FlhA
MSIDSDLSSGLIDETEARLRRKNLAKEAEFYGAMDGASRFTQRDAVASILITSINIVAGFLIGVLQHGMDLSRAIQTYTILTIGDGLVTVIPALMISISGGLIVTRASSEERLGSDFEKQLFGNPQPLLLASGVLIILSLFPVSGNGFRSGYSRLENEEEAGGGREERSRIEASRSQGEHRDPLKGRTADG